MKITLLILFALLSGCASMTTEYWEDRYEELEQADEISESAVLEYELGLYPYPYILCGPFFCGTIY